MQLSAVSLGLGGTLDQNWFFNAIRWFFMLIDVIVYQLLNFIYQILFNLADSPILGSGLIKTFYGRVQLIIGVLMIFKLSISILQVVINPDLMTDQKKGLGKIITRILTMLAMFTAIIPLNIPNAAPGSYNAYLNQHGLLFGTMYSLQSRILGGGVIQNLVLGYAQPENNTASTGVNAEDAGRNMAVSLLKVFVRINVIDENAAVTEDNYRVPPNKLKSTWSEAYDTYNSPNVTVGDLCIILNATDGKYYAFTYTPIVSTIVGGLILFVLIGFCIDVAIRALKLAVLRLIAPIPIISYIDPKSSENGTFANWIKLLLSTFLNLFIILFVVHLAVFLVEQLLPSLVPGGSPGQLDISFSNNFLVNALTIIFIIVGIFYFAKQAPKFVMDALGIKSLGLGAGLSGVLGAAGSLIGGGGLAGAASGFMNASTQAAEAAGQGKQAPPAYSGQRDRVTQMLTGDKDAKGGLLGNVTKAMQDVANNRMAYRNLGINRNMVGQGKEEMYRLKSAAASAEEAYKRYSTGNMTDQEINDIQGRQSFIDFLASPDGGGIDLSTYSGLGDDARRRIMQTYLEDDWSSKQTAANKQEAWYNDGMKILEGFNINETLQEKYSVRGRGVRRANRLYQQGDGYQEPANRDYGRSHEYRTGHVGRLDPTRARDEQRPPGSMGP